MSLLLLAPRREMQSWKEAIQKIDPSLIIEIYPDVKDTALIKAAVLWNHPKGVLSEFPNLKWVISLGAGVDHILEDKNIPDQIRIARIVDPGIPDQMAKVILTMLTEFEKGFLEHRKNQEKKKWHSVHEIRKLKVGILGMGEIGKRVTDVLTFLNYQVEGFNLSGTPYKQIKIYSPGGLNNFLNNNDVIICLLPLTSETEKMINREFFQQMKPGSFFMNLARGKIVDEESLLWAIEKGVIKNAYLDVFETEPLPKEHPFWENEKIIITPHISGITDVHAGASQIVHNYHTFESTGLLENEIIKHREY